MRLTSIWTYPSLSFVQRLSRTREWGTIEIANRLPKSIKYWVTINELARATMTSTNIPMTTLDEILRKMDTNLGVKK